MKFLRQILYGRQETEQITNKLYLNSIRQNLMKVFLPRFCSIAAKQA